MYALDARTVLRRYRRRDVPARELDVMRYVRERGYPAPEVIRVEGPDLPATFWDAARDWSALDGDVVLLRAIAPIAAIPTHSASLSAFIFLATLKGSPCVAPE